MDKGGKIIVSASVPRINELICIIGRISSTDIEDSLITESLYHIRILKCRMLIYLLPEIIASPMSQMKSYQGDIYILTKTDLFQSGKIQSELNELNIKHFEIMEKVTKQIYEACLNYTISFKISPQWNKVDQYLIQGKYFLASPNAYPNNAVKMEILMNDPETRFSLSPASVTVPSLSLEYFCLSTRIIENFIADNNGAIILNGFDSQSWVYVLPSLKKGRVILISKKIPETSPFKDYEGLKRHWKNMYGYRLPETDSEMIYYQINFPGLGESSYTYPNCCVRSNKLNQLRLDNPEDVGRQFLKDLTERVPEICNAPLTLEEIQCQRAMYYPREEEFRKENIANAQSLPAQNVERIPNRKRNFQENSESRSNPGYTLSGNYIRLFNKYYFNKGDDYRRSFSTLLDNSSNLKPKHDIIKEKNLRQALNMKSYLRVQSASRKTLATSSSSKFLSSVIGNTHIAESPNMFELASRAYERERRLKQLLLTESCGSTERKFSPQNRPIKIDKPDELSAEIENSKETPFSANSQLQNRSSFDLNDFKTGLGNGNNDQQIFNRNFEPNGDENSNGREVEIRSRYFADLGKDSQIKADDLELEKSVTSSTKLKLYRLSNGIKPKTRRLVDLKSERKDRWTANIKTNDISTYFKQKKQVRVSSLPETCRGTNISPFPKLIQTKLDFGRSGESSMVCVEQETKARRLNQFKANNFNNF